MSTPNDTPAAEYAELDPHTLVLADNVRDRVDLDADPRFVASIREHGVMLALNAVRRGEDDAIVVEDGQRRVFPRK